MKNSSPSRADAFEKAVRLLRAAERGVALTGAGISVDSGVPDFRSGGGIWERYDPAEYATIQAFLRDPAKVWGFFRELMSGLEEIEPNAGHRALAQLEASGPLTGVITQNIDGLHEACGSTTVAYHGRMQPLNCPACHWRQGPADATARVDAHGVPRCPLCGGPAKPAVVLFGELIDRDVAGEAERLASAAQVMIVAGTSALVTPAADLPSIVVRGGGTLIEVNLHPTPLTPHAVFLQGSTSDVLPALAAAVRRK